MNLSMARRNAIVNFEAPQYNSAIVRMYTLPKPANADTAVSTQTMICQGTMAATAFQAASGGAALANAVTMSPAVAAGDIGWMRIFDSTGTNVLSDFQVGLVGSLKDVEVSRLDMRVGEPVLVNSFTLGVPG